MIHPLRIGRTFVAVALAVSMSPSGLSYAAEGATHAAPGIHPASPVAFRGGTGCKAAIYEEDFDALLLGELVPQAPGQWEPWDGVKSAGHSEVSDDFSRSFPHSVRVSGPDDLVGLWGPLDLTSGRWNVTAHVFTPAGATGQSFFILLNQYVSGGAKNWSTQLRLDTDLGEIVSEPENDALPLITGKWVEIRVLVDLDQDLQAIWYDDTLLSAKSWTDGLTGGGTAAIAAVDLYANGASSFYYDDIQICDAGPPEFTLLCAAAGPDDLEYRNAIGAVGNARVGYFDAEAGTPSLELLQMFDAVHVWAVPTTSFSDAMAFGDNLAAYEQGGGCVVLGTGCAGALAGSGIMALSPAVSGGGQFNLPPSMPAIATPGCSCAFGRVGALITTQVVDKLTVSQSAFCDGYYSGLGSQTCNPSLGETVCARWNSGSPRVVYANGTGGQPIITYPPNDVPCLIVSIITECHGVKTDNCPIDLSSNGVVDFPDVLAVLAAWGNFGGPEDLNHDCVVNFQDLLLVLSNWGPCPV